MNKTAMVISLSILLAGCMGMPRATQVPSQAEIVDEPMAREIIVRSAFVDLSQSHPDMSVHRLRFIATFNRQTGQTIVLAQHELRHRMGGWVFPSAVDYMDSEGVLKAGASFTRSRGEVDGCGYGCAYTERAGFVVPEADLRALAEARRLDTSKRWRMRLVTQRGYDDSTGDLGVLPSFLQAMDSVRAAKFGGQR